MRVVVTGAGGHLGGWIVALLARRGVAVTATAGPGEDPTRLAADFAAAGVDPARLSIVSCELADRSCWPSILAGHDALIHVAAPMPRALDCAARGLLLSARETMLALIEAAHAAGIRRVVHTSSVMAALYRSGRPSGHVITESDWSAPGLDPMTPYAEAKTVAERVFWEATRGFGIGATAINPGILFGPSLTGSMSPSLHLFGEVVDGRAIVAPRILLPMVDVRDAAALHVAALFSDAAVGERIFAVADQLWLMDFIARVRAEGLDHLPVPRPLDDARAHRLAESFSILGYLRYDIGQERRIASDKAARLLDQRWRPTMETIGDTVRFLLGRAAARQAA